MSRIRAATSPSADVDGTPDGALGGTLEVIPGGTLEGVLDDGVFGVVASGGVLRRRLGRGRLDALASDGGASLRFRFLGWVVMRFSPTEA
jgi:hypothetical protein